MSSLIQITLGVLTAMGGFVDIGELVFSVQAGVKFGFALLWAVLVGAIGIIVFSEASGRIAAVHKKAVFEIIKDRFSKRVSILVLILSTILNILTCAAEVGGVAIALQLLTGLSHLPALILTVGVLILIVWTLPFNLLEKIFGLLGLGMVIFIAAVITRHIPSGEISSGLIPKLPHYNLQSIYTYLYFALGIISSTMMPYEVYFYSSGGIEEKWDPKKLIDNKLTAIVGMSLGALVSGSLLVLGADIFKPLNITPNLHGTSVLLAAIPFGKIGMIIALIGIIFAISGAALETCFAGAYNIAQYFEWRWGRHLDPTKTQKFSATWITIFIFSFFVLLFNIDPVDLVEYAVIFSLLALPFTYYAVLKVAADKRIMQKHASGNFGKTLGWIYFVLICILAIVSIPLMILTNMGKG
ncbi:MAG TPA: Nramp family divalent metal transporter [Candidatus Saccharimonadales bacterium]|nr:Nramp family divalent metal transporter [Candidatus Saccharimonadales bacterium]